MSENAYVGIDLSLQATGFCVKQGTAVAEMHTIKTTPKTCENDLKRLRYVCNEVMAKIPKDGVKMICIEDFFSSPNAGSAIKLAGLGVTVRLAVYEAGFPFFLVAPTSLKKYILGTGTGEKSLVLREVYKKWGVEALDDNAADACVLSRIAESIYMARNSIAQDDLLKPQKEVISALLAASKERGYNLV